MKTKLIEIFKSMDAEGKLRIDESVIDGLVDLFSSKDEDYAKKLENVIGVLNDRHEKKIKDLDGQHAKMLTEAVDSLKNRHQAEFERIDEEHTAKMQEIINRIDENHTKKMQEIVNRIDENHTQMLQEAVETVKKANATDDKLVAKISNFLDTKLNESIPDDVLVDRIKLHRLEKMNESIKKVLLMNDDYVQGEIKEAMLDAKQMLESKEKEFGKLMVENVELKKKVSKHEADFLLESKVKDMPSAQKTYIHRLFKDSTKEEIVSGLNEAVEAYKKQEKEERLQLMNESKSKLGGKINPIPTMPEIPVNDDKAQGSMMERYAQVVEKSIKR